MACIAPKLVYYDTQAGRNPATGKYPISFKPCNSSLPPITIPCGQCRYCRLEKSRQWALRCIAEASLWPQNCFITLTYAPEYLPKDGSLVKKHFQDFMKRLRKKYGAGIRYFYCGEYGALKGRPHYHALLFNFDFPDKELHSVSKSGALLYCSPSLNSLWPFGYSTIGNVTFESAAYVARYVMKKVTGKQKNDYYGGRLPEFCDMSRRPGIARGWYEQYKKDVFPHDCVILPNGKKCKPPKYFDKLLETENLDLFEAVKDNRLASRVLGQIRHLEEKYPDYIVDGVPIVPLDDFQPSFFVKYDSLYIQDRKLKKLKRGLEDEI